MVLMATFDLRGVCETFIILWWLVDRNKTNTWCEPEEQTDQLTNQPCPLHFGTNWPIHLINSYPIRPIGCCNSFMSVASSGCSFSGRTGWVPFGELVAGFSEPPKLEAWIIHVIMFACLLVNWPVGAAMKWSRWLGTPRVWARWIQAFFSVVLWPHCVSDQNYSLYGLP